METQLMNVVSKLCGDEVFNLVQCLNGEVSDTVGEDIINILYPSFTKDFHFEEIVGMKIKHNQNIFADEGSLNYVHNDLTLARYKGGNIYLLFSLMDENEELLESILKNIIPKAIDVGKEKKEHNFKQAVSSAIESRVDEYRDRIQSNNSECENLQQQILNTRLQIETDTQALTALNGTKGQWIAKGHKEYKNLFHLIPNMYSSFRIEEDTLIATTNEVCITYDSYKYVIGEFDVHIDLKTGNLKITNETNKTSGYDHPHINNGNPCLGNIADGLIRMITEFELFGALQMIYNYLHSYNADSVYHKIEFWNPDYEDNESDRYESCHEDNSGFSCVECGDGDCPFYQYAYEDCAENASLDDCIGCHYQCSFGRERIKEHEAEQLQLQEQEELQS